MLTAPPPLPPTDFSRGPCGMTPPENSPVGCGGGGGGRGAGRRGSFLSILPSSCLLAQVQVHSTGHCDLVISGQCYAAPSGSCRVSQSLCAFPQARPGHRSSGGFCPGQWTGSFTPLPPPAPLCPPPRCLGCQGVGRGRNGGRGSPPTTELRPGGCVGPSTVSLCHSDQLIRSEDLVLFF